MRLFIITMMLAFIGQAQTKPSDSDAATAPVGATSPAPPATMPSLATRSPSVKFTRGQRVYIVAVETTSRDLNSTRANFQIERRAKDEFAKARAFRVVSALRDSDFVFLVLLDAESRSFDEVALAVSPNDYERLGGNLDSLRNAALWQSNNHEKVGREAALAGATLGVSALFHNPSVVKGLVKQFHEDVIGSSK